MHFKNNATKLLLLLTLLWILIIFSFSLQPADVSSDFSSGFGRWLLETFVPGLLEYMEALSTQELEHWHFLLRKGAHFAEYFVLGVLMLCSLLQLRGQEKKEWILRYKQQWQIFLLALVLCGMVASADETIQLFVAGRAGRVADVVLDCLGTLTGLGLAQLACTIFRKFCIKRNHWGKDHIVR